MVLILCGKFIVYKDTFVCSNVILLLGKSEHYVILCFVGIMRVVIWTMRQKEFHAAEKFNSSQLIWFFKDQLKVKIRMEKKQLTASELSVYIPIGLFIFASLFFSLIPLSIPHPHLVAEMPDFSVCWAPL